VSFNQFDASDDSDALDAFDGRARLFPLPNVVLFPGVVLPLHIFEPRYRQMLSDAMDTDRLITMVLLKPGYEDEYEGSPPIFDVGCIGRVIYHEPLSDGRSNLILRGLQRVRIESEVFAESKYRQAQVTILHDSYAEKIGEAVDESVQSVFESLTEILTLIGRGTDADKLSIARDLPAGRLCDIATHCLSFDIHAKQSLLSEVNVAHRVEVLLAWMGALLQSVRRQVTTGQAPRFSQN
jgi:Lon protease-like protein